MRHALSLIAAAAAIFTAAPAFAAVDYFLKLDGIPGVSKDQAGAIDVLSWSWGVSQSASIGSATGGAGAGKASPSSIVITKTTDSASPLLFKACANGQHIRTAVLTVRKSGGQQGYMTITLSDVLISSVTAGPKGSEVPTESITLNFTKMEEQDTAGGTTATPGWGEVSKGKTGTDAWSH
jgi:type VI secretion system secreted protein Hcp